MPNSMSKDSVLFGNEKDKITAAILYKLYPNIKQSALPYQETKFANDYFDLSISNVPFGQIKVFDPAFAGRELSGFTGSIHNYFIAKMIQQTRPGGLIAVVTSSYTMNSQDPSIRKYISNNTKFLGAIRLPRTAFENNAGTQVTTDILFLQKFNAGEDKTQTHEFIKTRNELYDKSDLTGQEELSNNEYFIKNPDHVIGKTLALSNTGMYRDNEMGVVDNEKRDLEEAITNLADKIVPERTYTQLNESADEKVLKEKIKMIILLIVLNHL